MRMIYNGAFYLDSERRPEDALKSSTSDVLLRSLTITVGNLCNLQCRMCNPYSSSRIAADPIHSAWFGDAQNRGEMKNIAASYVDILRTTDSLTHLQISGGEPLIIPDVHRLLQTLIDSGRAQHMTLMMPTNCIGVKTSVSKLLSQFKDVHLRLSLDGHRHANEYIRYPGNWQEIVAAIETFKRYENIKLTIGFTLSALNVFEVSKLALWGDIFDIPFTFGVVHTPARLSIGVLPQSTLDDAANEADRAAEAINCESTVRELHAVVRLLRSYEPHVRDDALWRKFVAFTNDLDQSRGQSIERSLPNLIESVRTVHGPWRQDLRNFTA